MSELQIAFTDLIGSLSTLDSSLQEWSEGGTLFESSASDSRLIVRSLVAADKVHSPLLHRLLRLLFDCPDGTLIS